jgi:hypothetical protein
VLSVRGFGRVASGGIVAMNDDEVVVVLPVDGFTSVARLVTGGLASRLGFGFETIDDLQLAVELILRALPDRRGSVELSLSEDGSSLRLAIQPVGDLSLAAPLQPLDGVGVELGQSLERLADSVELTANGEQASLVLTKALPARVA